MIRRIDTDLIANSVQEIDNLWRAVAHRMGSNWVWFGNLAAEKQQQVFRKRAFQLPVTISVCTGKDPGGDGYVLYARQVPVQLLEVRK